MVCSKLIESIVVPKAVNAFESICPNRVDIYNDRVVMYGPKEKIWLFQDFTGVSYQTASLACAYASIIFLNRTVRQKWKNGGGILADENRMHFCAGMFTYKPANEFVIELANKIGTAMDAYKNRVNVPFVKDITGVEHVPASCKFKHKHK